jgi:hypothetical protein
LKRYEFRGFDGNMALLVCEECGALVENSREGVDAHAAFHNRIEALEWVASRPKKIGG